MLKIVKCSWENSDVSYSVQDFHRLHFEIVTTAAASTPKEVHAYPQRGSGPVNQAHLERGLRLYLMIRTNKFSRGLLLRCVLDPTPELILIFVSGSKIIRYAKFSNTSEQQNFIFLFNCVSSDTVEQKKPEGNLNYKLKTRKSVPALLRKLRTNTFPRCTLSKCNIAYLF